MVRFFFIFFCINFFKSFLIGQTADLIFFGGDILTMDKENPSPETVAVADGKIIFVGDKKKALFLQSDQTQWINLQKGALLPGFVSVSSNLLTNGLTKSTLDLSSEEIKTFSEIEDLLKQAAKHGPVLAMGYQPSRLTKKQKLGLKRLDKISQTQPIVVISKSGVIGYGNKMALKLAGVDENLDGGTSLHFQKNRKGKLTGVALSEHACMMLIKPFEELLKLDFKKILERSMMEYAKKGYTTVADHGFGNPLISLSKYLKYVEEISTPSPLLRIKGFGPFSQINNLKELEKKPRPFFEALGIQICYDGPVQNYEGFVKERYKGKNTKGITFLSKFDLNEQMILSRKNGFLVKIKASGDQAIEEALHFCEKTQIHHFSPKNPFILDQCALADTSSFKKMIDSHVSPSFAYQNIYLWGDVLKEKILGNKRINLLDCIKTSLNLGIPTSIQEGGALGHIDPFLSLQTFISRQTKYKTVINQEQKISLDQGLKSLTLDPCIQLSQEASLGSIEVGKNADFVILNKNPKKVPITQFSTIKVINTWIDGKKTPLFN